MKRTLLSFTSVLFFAIANFVLAQEPIEAKWGITGFQSGDNVVNNTTDLTANISAEMKLSRLRIYNSTSNTNNVVQDNGSNITDWQKIATLLTEPTTANGGMNPDKLPHIYNEADQSSTFHEDYYIEYVVKANDLSKYLQIREITSQFMQAGSNAVRIVAKYSVDGGVTFNYFPKPGRFFNVGGTVLDGNGDPIWDEVDMPATLETPLRPKRNNQTADANNAILDISQVTFTLSQQINVAPGKSFHIRFYPYIQGSSQGNGTLGTREVSISGIASTTEPVVLPLDFLSFTAKSNALGNAVNLEWQTTNEVNTQQFIVEKRTDKTEFTAIGSVLSKNTSGINSYSFTDNNVIQGNVYYRLKQVDNNGDFKYSSVALVSVGGLSLSVYPNPVVESLNVLHEAAVKGTLRVLGLDGKIIVNQDVAEGTTSSSLNVSSLSAGTYILVYDNAGSQSTFKFVKN